MNFRSLALSTLLSALVLPYAASQTAAPSLAASALTAVPPLVPYSGQLEGRTGQTSATFLIYKDQQGGEPLFTESQMIIFDQSGHYKVQLGASLSGGLPSGLFATGEARWLEVQIAGQEPQPRVLLSSVPYALKAADAATLGGLPASAFALVGSKSSPVTGEPLPAGVIADASSTVTTTGGVSGYLPRFSGASTVVDSQIFDNGTDVGIGTSSPTAKLDVNGTAIIAGGLNAQGGGNFGGSLNILATGNATASSGKASQPLAFVASSYNNTSNLAVPQIFRWIAEPTGNDTISPSSSLELFFSSGSGTPAATGLAINAAGQITFAPGQSFEGNTTVEGNTTTSPGVIGESTDYSGVEGISSGGAEKVAGVTGSNLGGGLGVGVLGLLSNFSDTGQTFRTGGDEAFGAGVWGDSNLPASVGYTPAVMGTADDQYAGYFANSSGYSPTLLVENVSSGPYATLLDLNGGLGNCQVDIAGDLYCTGSKSAVVPVDNNTRKVALYAVESPENWFEDFGSGQLSNGVALVTLEPVFAQTVNLGVDYHVFLTPNGDSKGLYVSRKTATSFEVRESGSGSSTVAFDYRIVARRKGYEAVRLADKTKQQEFARKRPVIAP
jgi:hypothetical protein